MDTNIHITAICGSLREGSRTKTALEVALEGAKASGATTHLIDLRNYDLSFCKAEKEGADVAKLQEDVGKSHGIILGTPVYHGGISGVLKNALDLMGSKEFSGRVVGLMGVAGGSTGAVLPLASLRTIGRSLHAWVIPHEVSIANAYDAFDDEGQLLDMAIRDRLLTLGRDVARFSYLHHSEQTQQFVNMWENSIENHGGD